MIEVVNPAPVFSHYLARLQHLLALVARSPGEALLTARLAPDMLPFANQVRTAARFALRGCCPLFGLPLPAPPTTPASLAGLQQEVAEIEQWLAALPRVERVALTDPHLGETAGFAELRLPAGEFLQLYLLPNFFFHLSMVYAIARQQGVTLGKGDFDGFHQYPAGFSFSK